MSAITLNTPCFLLTTGEKNKFEDQFEKIVEISVEEIFSSLGRSCKHALYTQLEVAFGIKKQEIPKKIEAFADALEKIFGASAKLVELRIIEKLHSKIPDFIYSPEKKDLEFTEYLENLDCLFKAQVYYEKM